jgi:hypothetical protein
MFDLLALTGLTFPSSILLFSVFFLFKRFILSPFLYYNMSSISILSCLSLWSELSLCLLPFLRPEPSKYVFFFLLFMSAIDTIG